MRCFIHQDREAIGTCRACSRGLCPDCASAMPFGLACRGSHEQLVQLSYEALARTAQIHSAYGKVRYLGAGLFSGLGVFSGVYAWTSGGHANVFYFYGVLTIAVGVALFYAQRRAYGKLGQAEKSDA